MATVKEETIKPLPPPNREEKREIHIELTTKPEEEGGEFKRTTVSEISEAVDGIYVSAGSAGVSIDVQGEFITIRCSDSYDSTTVRLRAW